MSDPAIQNAKARRDKIAAEINDFQEKIADLKRDLARVDQFIADWNAFSLAEPFGESPVQGGDAKKANPDRAAVGMMAANILHENQAPLLRADLFRTLAERGVHIYGKNPEMVLSTMMWRMQDQFVRIPGWGYWFRDRPFEPAKYKPGDIRDTRTKEDDQIHNEMEDLL